MAVPGMKERKDQDAESWSCTLYRQVKLSHTWTIDHFSHRQDNSGVALKSSVFSASTENTRTWCMIMLLHPTGNSEDVQDYISFYLKLVSSTEPLVRASFKMSLLKSNGSNYCTSESQRGFKAGEYWGFLEFIRRDVVLNGASDILLNDQLTIVCDINVLEDDVTIAGQINSVRFKNPYQRLSDDLRDLFESKKFADVTFSVGGLEIPAHKSILAARSPVFEAMFQDGWEEGKRNKVEMKEIDFKVMKEMLRFIYTGKVTDLEKVADDLLEPAEKYQLEGLKEICEEALCSHLSVEKAAEYLILADLYRAARLKDRALAFINMHAKDVKKTPGWQTLYTSYPQLLADAWMTLLAIPTK